MIWLVTIYLKLELLIVICLFYAELAHPPQPIPRATVR